MINLSPRLKAAAELVEPCRTFADIGCDHGFLSAYLLQSKKCKEAICCDINKGPLNSARQTMQRLALGEACSFRLASGLDALKAGEAQEIAVAGMGAELIASILSACPFAKDEKIHFIFQPMTHPEILREYLCKNGFEIGKEILVSDSKHVYTVFDARFTGAVSSNELLYYIGKISDFSSAEAKSYFSRLIKYLQNKAKGGRDYSHIINAVKEKL